MAIIVKDVTGVKEHKNATNPHGIKEPVYANNAETRNENIDDKSVTPKGLMSLVEQLPVPVYSNDEENRNGTIDNKSVTPQGLHEMYGQLKNWSPADLAAIRAGTADRYARGDAVKNFVEEKIDAIFPDYPTISIGSAYSHHSSQQFIFGSYGLDSGYPNANFDDVLIQDGVTHFNMETAFQYGLNKNSVGYSNNPSTNPDLHGTVQWLSRVNGWYLEFYRARSWWDYGNGNDSVDYYGKLARANIKAILTDKLIPIYGTYAAASARLNKMISEGVFKIKLLSGIGDSSYGGRSTCGVKVNTSAIDLPVDNPSGIHRPSAPPTSSPSPYYTRVSDSSSLIWESIPSKGSTLSTGTSGANYYQGITNKVSLAVYYVKGGQGTFEPMLEFVLYITSGRTQHFY